MHETNQGDLEHHTLIGRAPHVEKRLAKCLHHLHDARGTEATSLIGEFGCSMFLRLNEFRRHLSQEAVAQMTNEIVDDGARIAATMHGVSNGRQRTAGVELDEGLDEFVDRCDFVDLSTGGGQEFERRQRVTGRPTALTQNRLETALVEGDASILRDPPHVLFEIGHREQVELQVLRAAANGFGDLLGVGRGEDEHHVRRRLFEGLEKGGRRRTGELVHLVEDVHLVATGGAQGRSRNDLANVFDAAIARGVEFDDVEAAAVHDCLTRTTRATRFAVDRSLAVENFGEDARRGGLASTSRTREEIRMADAIGLDSIAQCEGDVILPSQLGEALGPITPIERLVSGVGHAPTLQMGCGRGSPRVPRSPTSR